VSTWTFPLAFNTPFAELDSRQFNPVELGDLVEIESRPVGELIGGDNAYAYLFEWSEFYASRTLYRLLDAGVRAKVATSPFTTGTAAGSREFGYGSILVPVGPQDVSAADIHAMMRRAVEEDGLTVYALQTGRTSEGIDIGSPSFRALRKPEIAIVTGEGMRVSEVGEAWHTFDQKFDMPVTLLTQQRMQVADLSRYNVLVMPSGNYSNVRSDDIREWVQAGGTLIVYKTALEWAAREELVNLKFVEDDDEPSSPRPYAALVRDRGEQLISGSIFNARLDLSHPLGYGYTDEFLPVFRDSAQFLQLPENRYAAPLIYTSEPLLSGYVSEQNLRRLADTAAIVVGRQGSGRVIAMTDNPNFRAYWFGTTRLFMNAVFFGHTVNALATE